MNTKPPFLRENHLKKAQEILQNLSLDERIAQLLHAAAYSNRGADHEQHLLGLIKNHGIGGLIFFQGDPVKQARQINLYQEAAKVPLLISIDGEWGLGMRLINTLSFPYHMTMGALQNTDLVYRAGAEMAKHCRRAGININFAPVTDVNNNPGNPVINFRSFGENKYNVAEKSNAFIKGIQGEGVLACAKHFPGHGDTDADSHLTLPVIGHDKSRLRDLELYPFAETFKQGLGCVMVAHLSIPALDDTPNLPSTLSPKIVTDLMKKEMAYEGLVFTDALDMKGIADLFPGGIADYKAFEAGNDVMLFSTNVPKAVKLIREGVENGAFPADEVDRRCVKSLAAKDFAGLFEREKIVLENMVEDLFTPESEVINFAIAREAVTVLRNENAFPVPTEQKVAFVTLGAGQAASEHSLENFKELVHHQQNLGQKSENANTVGYTKFQKTVRENYTNADFFRLDPADLENFAAKSAAYDRIVVGLHNLSLKPTDDFGLSELMKNFVAEYAPKSIIVLFGNPYILDKLPGSEKAAGLIVTYQESDYMQVAAAEILNGKIKAKGRLPVSVNAHFPGGAGL